MMLLAFILPVLASPLPYTLFPSDVKGDVLNITQCYCHRGESGPINYGYYVRFLHFISALPRSHQPGDIYSNVYFTDGGFLNSNASTTIIFILKGPTP